MLRRIASAGAAAAIVVSGFAAVAASLALTATPVQAAACTIGPGVAPATITLSACTGLTDGQVITVSGTGYTASTTVVVAMCVPPVTTADQCNSAVFTQDSFPTASPTGAFSTSFTVHQTFSTVTNGAVTCNSPGTSECAVIASTYPPTVDPQSPANGETVLFGVVASPSPSPVVSPVVSPSPSPTPVVILAAAPALPAAGSAGSPGPSGGSVPVEALLLAAVASAVVGALAWRARVYKKSQGT